MLVSQSGQAAHSAGLARKPLEHLQNQTIDQNLTRHGDQQTFLQFYIIFC